MAVSIYLSQPIYISKYISSCIYFQVTLDAVGCPSCPDVGSDRFLMLLFFFHVYQCLQFIFWTLLGSPVVQPLVPIIIRDPLLPFIPLHPWHRCSRRCDKLQDLSSLQLAQHLTMRRGHPGEVAGEEAEAEGEVRKKRIQRMKARMEKDMGRNPPTAVMPT